VPEHIVSRKVYAVVCVSLLILTALTWALGQVDLGRSSLPIALAIASCKALLVAFFFMHLRYSPRRTRLVGAAGMMWLAILLLITMSDYFTRP